MSFASSLKTARAVLTEAYTTYSPSHIFLFLSGGYDSAATTFYSWELLAQILRQVPRARRPDLKVVHINTQTGVPETRMYVYQLQYLCNWPFVEYRTPIRYEDIIRKHGFPGPPAHKFCYILLKERAIDQLVRDHTPQKEPRRVLFLELLRESRAMPFLYQQYLYAALAEEYQVFQGARRSKVLFITGVRSAESQRRFGHVQPIQVDGRRVWVAPFIDFTKEEILEAMDGLPRNPVVDCLHGSRECNCGAFAKPFEAGDIAFWYPATGRQIRL